MRAGIRAIFVGLLIVAGSAAWSQELVLQCDAGRSKADWNLSDPLHTVKGDFKMKACDLHYDAASGKASGEVVFDATTGQSGNSMRDRKMHKDVLESRKYPEIRFRPDHVEGMVAAQGVSTVQVHGIFSIHGSDHEVTLPVELTLTPTQWTATAHFSVPYVKWGMKNPSVLFLRVGDEVAIDFQAAGNVVSEPARASR
jgi:polyisoprenoid-binding protein YceI